MTETDRRLDAVERSRGLDAFVPELAAEFPGYFIGVSTQQTWNGVSLSAHDKDRAAHPGVYAVVTKDPDEMRRTLRQDQQ
jgi:hypothetical protein